MINRILLIVTICLSLILLFMSSRNTTFFNTTPNITIKDSDTNKIETSLFSAEYKRSILFLYFISNFGK